MPQKAMGWWGKKELPVPSGGQLKNGMPLAKTGQQIIITEQAEYTEEHARIQVSHLKWHAVNGM